MSRITKRKHVTREVLEEFVLPNDEQKIVKVVASRGNNLHEVENADGDRFLVSMPSKFRKNVWIKRGDFVIVETISEGLKVKAEICIILYPEQIKYITREGKWPEAFVPKVIYHGAIASENSSCVDSEIANLAEEQLSLRSNGVCSASDTDSDSSSDNEEDLFVNTNRPTLTYYYTDDSTDEEEENHEEGNQLSK